MERHLARSTPGGFHTLHHGLKLFNRGGPLQIGGRHQDFPAFVLPPRGQLATRGGFPEPCKPHNITMVGPGSTHMGAKHRPHQFHEFVVDHADHFFARLQTFGDFSAEGFGDDFFAERIHHLVVHIGFQKCGRTPSMASRTLDSLIRPRPDRFRRLLPTRSVSISNISPAHLLHRGGFRGPRNRLGPRDRWPACPR